MCSNTGRKVVDLNSRLSASLTSHDTEALQSLMILPRTPTSSPTARVPEPQNSTAHRHCPSISPLTATATEQANATSTPNLDPSTLLPAEMLEYIRKLQTQNATLTSKVKHEIKDEDDVEGHDQEAYRSRMKKRAKLSNMDIIDVDALD